MSNIGTTYSLKGEKDKALEYHEKALEMLSDIMFDLDYDQHKSVFRYKDPGPIRY